MAWTQGFSASDNNVSIAREGSPACGDRFEVAGNTYYLEGCADPDTGYAQGRIGLWALQGGVKETRVQWEYLGTHDVVKRYLCGQTQRSRLEPHWASACSKRPRLGVLNMIWRLYNVKRMEVGFLSHGEDRMCRTS